MVRSATLSLVPLLGAAINAASVTIPATPLGTGPVISELISTGPGLGALDYQKLTPGPNDTSFDWWYFDTVSTTDKSSFWLVLMQVGGGVLGLPGVFPSNLVVTMAATSAEGDKYSWSTNLDGEAIISNSENSISSTWSGTDATFKMDGSASCTSSLPTYKISLNVPAANIKGTYNLRAITQSRYPCAAMDTGVSEQASPRLGWANAVPDGDADLNLNWAGTKIKISNGVSYHDKNWGDRSFAQLYDYWYWGHTRLGPYSIVWFDITLPNGSHSQSGYIAKEGAVQSLKCTATSANVRPWGPGAEYPPQPDSPPPAGVFVTMDLGPLGIFKANVTTTVVVTEQPGTQRFIGTVKGGYVGQTHYSDGRAFYDILT